MVYKQQFNKLFTILLNSCTWFCLNFIGYSKHISHENSDQNCNNRYVITLYIYKCLTIKLESIIYKLVFKI